MQVRRGVHPTPCRAGAQGARDARDDSVANLQRTPPTYRVAQGQETEDALSQALSARAAQSATIVCLSTTCQSRTPRPGVITFLFQHRPLFFLCPAVAPEPSRNVICDIVFLLYTVISFACGHSAHSSRRPSCLLATWREHPATSRLSGVAVGSSRNVSTKRTSRRPRPDLCHYYPCRERVY